MPAVGFFVVSNLCYENVHEEFVQNQKKVKEMLSEIIFKDYKELL